MLQLVWLLFAYIGVALFFALDMVSSLLTTYYLLCYLGSQYLRSFSRSIWYNPPT